MSGLNNEVQVAAIIERCIVAVDEKRRLEAKETRRWFGGNVSGWVAVLVLVVGAIVAGNNTHNLASNANARSIRNENAITALKADNGDRLARIETKIDLMMEERKK